MVLKRTARLRPRGDRLDLFIRDYAGNAERENSAQEKGETIMRNRKNPAQKSQRSSSVAKKSKRARRPSSHGRRGSDSQSANGMGNNRSENA